MRRYRQAQYKPQNRSKGWSGRPAGGPHDGWAAQKPVCTRPQPLVSPRIYKYQAHGYAFSGVEELLYSLGEATFVNMTQRSVAESLLQVGVTQRFIDDVVSAVLRASYGQSASMPAFAGAFAALSLFVFAAPLLRAS